jgi:NADH:ubiquinone oxidoreductase subunit F (NADH-binding)/(2Fe-2S) ferredoxin
MNPGMTIFQEQMLRHNNAELSAEVADKLALVLRHKLIKPVILLGYGTCGVVAGAQQTYEAVCNYLSENAIDADIIKVGCFGYCSEEPILEVQLPGKNRIIFKKVLDTEVQPILDAIFHNIVFSENTLAQRSIPGEEPWEGVSLIESLEFFQYQQRHVLRNCGKIDPCNIDEYIANNGYNAFTNTIRNFTRDEVCDIIQKSGLRGRGGSGYPTGLKWKNALNTPGEQKYLICNADESDPGAYMDRAIIEGDPHLLLEGIAIASYAIGATKAIIYIRSDYQLAIERLQHAINQARDLGLIGSNILESGFNLDIAIYKGAGAFVCGEETALIESLEGRRGMPRQRPPYPTERGLFGKPTVVNNVETLVNVPMILDNGHEWYAGLGTPDSPGTKIFSLAGKLNRKGIIEIPMGTPLRDIIFGIGGGLSSSKKFKMLQIGGPSGSCFTEADLDVRVDFVSLNKIGAFMGSGGMVVLDEDVCIIDTVKYFINYLQRQSCGKCIPCREGLRRIYEILNQITKRPQNHDGHTTLERFKGVMQLESLAEVIRDTSLCGLGQTAPNSILSTLKWFRAEYEEHIFDRKCRANVCRELRSFVIDVNNCTGCMSCAKRCTVNAIIGTKASPFFIVQEKCTSCGVCFDTCKFSAVLIQ